MKTRTLLAVFAATLLLMLSTGCERSVGVFEAKLSVLGTFANISISGLPEAEASKAAQAVEQDLSQLDHVGYTFAHEGELHELNEALARGESMTVSAELVGLIKTAREFYANSGGLINPAAGELIALWEFHCKEADCTESPYPEEVQRLVEEEEATVVARRSSMSDLVLDGNTVSSQNPSVKLEFGDLIRGYAMEKGIGQLKKMGIENAMIDIGGSVRGMGSRDNRPWWVHVMDASGGHSIGYVELGRDEAVVSVRAFDRSIGKQDFVYRHVVDPRSGLPVTDVKAVTVIHDNAVWANAAASALLVAGINDWALTANKMGVRAVMMITQDGTLYTNAAMEERLHWNQAMDHKRLVP